jgi:peptidoglycan-associated lipoprotein
MKDVIVLMAAAFLLILLTSCAKKQVVMPAAAPTVTKLEQAKAALPERDRTGPDRDLSAQERFRTVYFDFDSYALKGEFRPLLTETARYLRQNSDAKLKLDGHCDERGTIEYNLALGDKRANAVKRYLVDQGAKKDNISTFSYGKERPAVPGHGEEAWAQNRRTEGSLNQP